MISLRSIGLGAGLVLGLATIARAEEHDAAPLDYICEGGVELNLALDLNNNTVLGRIDDRTVILAPVQTGSGARYLEAGEGGVDAKGRPGRFEFWMKGHAAMLSWVSGDTSEILLKDCVLQ